MLLNFLKFKVSPGLLVTKRLHKYVISLRIMDDQHNNEQKRRKIGRGASSGNLNKNSSHSYNFQSHRQNAKPYQDKHCWNNHQDIWEHQQNASLPFLMLQQASQQLQMNQEYINRMQAIDQIPKTIFTINCGEVRPKDEGARVKISGKVVKRPRTGRFLEIRDCKGSTQLVATDDKPEISLKFKSIAPDTYITVVGTVQLRPNNFINNSISTGACEIAVEEFCRVVPPITEITLNDIPMSSQHQQRNYSTITNNKSHGITSTEYKKSKSENIMKYFVNRETTCGDLRRDDVGRIVTLVGWLDSKKHGKFLQLKDGYGLTQIIVDSDDMNLRSTVANVQEDSIVQVKGRVISRPPNMVRNNLDTGEIEVMVSEFTILDPLVEYDDKEETCEVSSGMDVEIESTPDIPQKISPRISDKAKLNLFTYRTHTCGELNESNIGQEVTLTGWFEFQRMRKFFTLRDGYGCSQVIIPDELCSTYNIEAIPFESVLKVHGVVLARPIGMKNPTMSTGGIEIVLKSLTLLNESMKNLPIEIRNFNRAKENLRLEHRYLDLRFSDMQKNLRIRSKVLMKMREYLIHHCGFIEVETPTLFRRTPGGAQEFVVPSQKAGKFYSLVQSPQQFKQLLMVGAIDRYFQIARCYRDEATRPDRQPEFTQLDIELSFTDREKIMALVEGLLVHCWPESNGTLSTPFPKMTYDDVMDKYGSDKPDLRFDMQLQNVTNLLALNEELSNESPDFAAYAIILKHPQSNIRNALKKDLKALEKDLQAKLVVSNIAVENIMDWVEGPLKNLLTSVVLKALAANFHLESNDLLVIGYGRKVDCQTLMGKVRTSLYKDLEIRGLVEERIKQENKFLWVIDFPMFTRNEEKNILESTHHPFTAPHPDDANSVDDLCNARSLAYDLVLNGQEIGGGSIRIHDAELQKHVLDEVLKLPREHLKHMIEALKSGAPPHGGIALGIDRIMSIICNTNSIRDVIAFPKAFEGKDPMSKAPCEISEEEKKLYHIKIIEDEEANEDEAMSSEKKGN
ncbi:CLUMA_CG014188, isoform A [Clunio marinus]|uniref:CLUMA_CG014188, isoform A n=1 Tax=Clunio marinus TaxID=568069 RepID=A0A1J1IPP3_9DIPT|nr:CLUMA_CG014188, isoform A [Clunio marinus]